MFEDQNSDNGMKNIKIFRHHIPRNQEELEKVKEILRTQDIFDRKLSLIYQKLDQIFKQIDYDKLNVEVWKWITSLNNEMNSLVRNLFAIELSKTKYTVDELKENNYPLFVQGRKIPCEICGESRVVEKCHILPNRMGGSLALENIFFLCPLHHKLLDNCALNQQEFAKLNLSDKSPKSIEYFNKVIEPNMKNFWKGQPEKYSLEKEFREEFKQEVIKYIQENQPVDIRKVIKNFIYAYKDAERIIMELKNKNYLIMNKEGRFILKSKKGIL